jgi:hypothetical protein
MSEEANDKIITNLEVIDHDDDSDKVEAPTAAKKKTKMIK